MKSKASTDDNATLLSLRASYEKDYQAQQKLPPHKRVKPLDKDKLADPIGIDTPDAETSKRADSIRLDSGLAKILAIQTQVNELDASPLNAGSKRDFAKVKHQLQELYVHSDSWNPRTIALRLDTIALRLDKIHRDKACGGSFIAEEKVCHVGEGAVSKAEAVPPSQQKQPDPKQVPFDQDKAFLKKLATVGLSAAIVTAVVGVAVKQVQTDLADSQVEFTGRVPPGGIPDQETYAKYDTFQPGDLIRKSFRAPGWGTRHHYAVYMGKDPKTGEHQMVEVDVKQHSRDGEPVAQKSPLTKGANENATEYDLVPADEMHKRQGTKVMSREEIASRAETMLGSTFSYRGFESNCESFARAIVEGKAYSTQGDKISGLTNCVASFVTENGSKIKLEDAGKHPEEGFQLGKMRLRWSDYAKDANRQTAQEMAAFLDKEKTRKDADVKQGNAAKDADALLQLFGMQSSTKYAEVVDLIAERLPGVGDEVRVEMYKNYLLLLFAIATSTKIGKALETKADKACGGGHIANNKQCRSGINPSQAQAQGAPTPTAQKPQNPGVVKLSHLAGIAGAVVLSRAMKKAENAGMQMVDKALDAAFQGVFKTVKDLATRFRDDPKKKEQVAVVKEKVEGLYNDPPEDLSEDDLHRVRQQLEQLYKRGDSLDPYVVSLRLSAIAIRLDKACGNGFIAEGDVCHLGQSSAPTVSTAASNTTAPRGKRGSWKKAALAMAALVGVSAGAYLATRAQYRSGFTKSAEMATARAKEIDAPVVKARQHTIVFGVGGMAYADESPSIISGERIITAAKMAFSRDKGKDLKLVPINNAGDNVPADRKRGSLTEQAQDVAGLYYRALQQGRNLAAVELAANVLAYAEKNPEQQLVMMGHSRGGVVVHEAQEILRRANPALESRLKSLVFGTQYGGITEKFGESHTIGSPHDACTSMMPTRDLKNFPDVTGHSQGSYFGNPAVKQFVSDTIYRDVKLPESTTKPAAQKTKKDSNQQSLVRIF